MRSRGRLPPSRSQHGHASGPSGVAKKPKSPVPSPSFVATPRRFCWRSQSHHPPSNDAVLDPTLEDGNLVACRTIWQADFFFVCPSVGLVRCERGEAVCQRWQSRWRGLWVDISGIPHAWETGPKAQRNCLLLVQYAVDRTKVVISPLFPLRSPEGSMARAKISMQSARRDGVRCGIVQWGASLELPLLCTGRPLCLLYHGLPRRLSCDGKQSGPMRNGLLVSLNGTLASLAWAHLFRSKQTERAYRDACGFEDSMALSGPCLSTPNLPP